MKPAIFQNSNIVRTPKWIFEFSPAPNKSRFLLLRNSNNNTRIPIKISNIPDLVFGTCLVQKRGEFKYGDHIRIFLPLADLSYGLLSNSHIHNGWSCVGTIYGSIVKENILASEAFWNTSTGVRPSPNFFSSNYILNRINELGAPEEQYS